ncbi:MAG: hypothetical protein ACTSRZ_13590 [Promethearchaeota archaeon]
MKPINNKLRNLIIFDSNIKNTELPSYLFHVIEDFIYHFDLIIKFNKYFDLNLEQLLQPKFKLVLISGDKIKSKGAGSEGYILKTTISLPDLERSPSFERGILEKKKFSFITEIISSSFHGLMNGLYGVLFNLGVRWYFPGTRPIVIPLQYVLYIPNRNTSEKGHKDILIKISRVLNGTFLPAFKNRSIVIYAQNRIFDDLLLFCARNRINIVYLHSEQGIEKAIEIFNKFGIMINVEQHIFPKFVCSENKQSMNRAYNTLRKKIKKIPVYPGHNQHPLYFWLADTLIQKCGNCKCEKHKKMNAGEVYLDFLNSLQIRINKQFPGLKLVYLAYLGSFIHINKLKPLQPLILEIAPMHRCFLHSISDDSCSINFKEVKNTLNTLISKFSLNYKKVLGYWLDSSLFGRQEYYKAGWGIRKNLGRIPNVPYVLQEDLKFYQSMSIDEISTFMVNISSDYLKNFTSPMIFLYSYLIWNPNLDIRQEIKNFCLFYYQIPQQLLNILAPNQKKKLYEIYSSFTNTLFKIFNSNDKIDPKHSNRHFIKNFVQNWNSIRILAERFINNLVMAQASYIPDKFNSLASIKPIYTEELMTRLNTLIKEAELIRLFKKKFWKGRLFGLKVYLGLKLLKKLICF